MSAEGFIILDKPEGLTSRQALDRLRHLLRERRAGFAGTLDPLASGVLLCAFGIATPLLAYRTEDDKEYQAAITLGSATSTDDREGPVIAEGPWRSITLAQVTDALASLQGTQWQRPPAYSAIAIGGERLYTRARRGEPIEAPPRQVTIYRIALTHFAPPSVHILVHCSKGTYIRALARDLGILLGSQAHLGALRRLRSGPFAISQAASLPALEQRLQHSQPPPLLPLLAGIPDIPQIPIDNIQISRIRNGNSIPLAHPSGIIAVIDITERRLIAIGTSAGGLFHPHRVLVSSSSPTATPAAHEQEYSEPAARHTQPPNASYTAS
ncbi:MAG: tRNA pseudouridine(55) synthase TruB [Chloroflexi bacterium]|nr:tRNA pseudouridine(55) synthase TruB [Chloroflexota bacterium]